MKKGQMIGGLVCLAVAAVLAVASWRLPPEKLMFVVGGINIPMIVWAVAGVALLVTARKR
jgi:mannose/fructose-specific phosphotransferase system component IIA